GAWPLRPAEDAPDRRAADPRGGCAVGSPRRCAGGWYGRAPHRGRTVGLGGQVALAPAPELGPQRTPTRGGDTSPHRGALSGRPVPGPGGRLGHRPGAHRGGLRTPPATG